MKGKQLYLIHTRDDDGQVWHYIGITQHRDARDRFRQHWKRRDRPAIYNKLHAARSIQLFSLHPRVHEVQERFVQTLMETGHDRQLCPACSHTQRVHIKQNGLELTFEPVLVHEQNRS